MKILDVNIFEDIEHFFNAFNDDDDDDFVVTCQDENFSTKEKVKV